MDIVALNNRLCDKWGIVIPEKRFEMEGRITRWLRQLTSDEVKNILLKLLENFEYYNDARVGRQLKYLYEQRLLNRYASDKDLFDDSRFFPITKDHRKTSSHEMYYGKFVGMLSKHVCLDNVMSYLKKQQKYIPDFEVLIDDYAKVQKEIEALIKLIKIQPEVAKDISKRVKKQEKILFGINRKIDEAQEGFDLLQVDNYIFVDDMIGTGETMEKFLMKFMSNFPKTELRSIGDVQIYLFVLEACEHGVDRLVSFCEENRLKLNIISEKENYHPKAFKPNYLFSQKESAANQAVIHDYEKISIRSRYPLGYEQSEALMAFYHNTPNNTISSFWHESSHWQALFPRNKHHKPNSKQKKNAALHLALERKGYFRK
jgi:hypoxanthine phosphoribosyltransferase